MWMRQNFIAQFVQLLKHWLCSDVQLGIATEKNHFLFVISASCRHCSFLESPKAWKDVLLVLFLTFVLCSVSDSNIVICCPCLSVGMLMLRTALSSLSWKYSFVLCLSPVSPFDRMKQNH